MSALETPNGGRFTLSTQLIEPKYFLSHSGCPKAFRQPWLVCLSLSYDLFLRCNPNLKTEWYTRGFVKSGLPPSVELAIRFSCMGFACGHFPGTAPSCYTFSSRLWKNLVKLLDTRYAVLLETFIFTINEIYILAARNPNLNLPDTPGR